MSIISSSSSTMDNEFLEALWCESRSRSEQSHNNIREASFSSYLTNAEETFIRRLTDSARKSQGLATDEEIGVFTAEKYFSEDMDYYVGSPRFTSQIDPVIFDYTTREMCVSDPMMKYHALTPSESSWNSGSVLLQSATAGNVDSPLWKKGKKASSFLAKLRIRCKCYCSGGDSIDVDDNPKEMIRTRTYNSSSSFADEVFTFPTMDSNPIPRNLKQQGEETLRESGEAFGSPMLQKTNKSTMKMKSHEVSDTDVSSELFEIESSKGNANAKAKTFLARQDSDGASSSRYAPSEASVEWSVVTASAADFSDYLEDVKPATSVSIGSPVYKNILMTKANKGARHLSPVLSGCSSLKSVAVDGEIGRGRGPGLDLDLLKRDYCSGYKKSLQFESTQRDFGSRNRVSASPRLFRQSSSARVSRCMF